MEHFAQGIGNIGSACSAGIPATGAIACTATNIKAGAKSPVSGMIHAVTLLAILMAFAQYAQQIPLAVLAGHPDGGVLQHERNAHVQPPAERAAGRMRRCW